jgi:hypothetical protein
MRPTDEIKMIHVVKLPTVRKKKVIVKEQTSKVAFDPKIHPAPRGLTCHVSISSGSDHIKSQKAPSCGISWLRCMVLI